MAFKSIKALFGRRERTDIVRFRMLFEKFQQILNSNNRTLGFIAELEDKLSGEFIFDINYLKETVQKLSEESFLIVTNLNILSENRYLELLTVQKGIQAKLESILLGKRNTPDMRLIIPLSDITRDDDDIVGSKNAILGEVKNHIHAPTPDGFGITVKAFHDFMSFNDLWDKIESIHTARPADGGRSHPEKEIEALFSSARFSPHLKKTIHKEIKKLIRKHPSGQRLVVRSSAIGEDAAGKSFAGQFHSVLNVRPDDVFDAFKQVLASRFRALPYGAEITGGNSDRENPMAVGVQTLVTAKAAGVAYSLDPGNPANNSIIISSVYGLGIPVVSGTMVADFFRVSRIDPTVILERKIATKAKKVVPDKGTGTETVPVPKELQDLSSLQDDQIRKIAEFTFIIERRSKRPQDIEWAIDENDQLVILQSRPLVVSQKVLKTTENLPELLKQYPVLIRKQGLIANRGIAIGKVCMITEDTNPEDFPVGGIAVTRYASPKLTRIFPKIAAILTDAGSSTGHMATIAREFGIPAIVGMENVSQILQEGMEITIDAHENIIYQGIIHELLEYESSGQDVFSEMPEYVTLRRILKNVAPLNLINPASKDFTVGNCLTYHDIIRFAHEKAIFELISLNAAARKFKGIATRDVRLPIPLGLKAIDIGGGLIDEQSCGRKIGLEDIGSVPVTALLEGLSSPNVWQTDPVKLDFGDFMSSLTRLTIEDTQTTVQAQNLVVFSDVYMNLSLRLGYHYNVIDAYLSENINNNYIYFRFVGGVTENERRNRRAHTIQLILEQLDFKVLVQGDLVIGKIKKRSEVYLKELLVQMGKLIGFTRQLDVKMISAESITEQSTQFFQQYPMVQKEYPRQDQR